MSEISCMHKTVRLLVFPILVSLLISGCHRTSPASIGMTKLEVTADKGSPDAKWIGNDGIECWKYIIGKSLNEKGGTWFVIFQNDRVAKVTPRGRNLNNLMIGLPELAAVEILGTPTSVSANKETKYLIYKMDINRYQVRYDFVRIVNGVVESYGEKGDFDSTKTEEKIINLNIDDKRKK